MSTINQEIHTWPQSMPLDPNGLPYGFGFDVLRTYPITPSGADRGTFLRPFGIVTETVIEPVSPSCFRETARAVHLYEKDRSSLGYAKEKVPGIDLNNTEHVAGLGHHVLVHAFTGLGDNGTSTTYSIPYWDREAFGRGVGLRHDMDPSSAEAVIQLYDALSLNVLRAFSSLTAGTLLDDADALYYLNQQLSEKQVTHLPQSEHLLERKELRQRNFADTSRVAIAKLKHLAYLTDLQPEQTRDRLAPEVARFMDMLVEAGVAEEDMYINLGVDGGLSSDTYRPPYVTKSFKQLPAFAKPEYSMAPGQLPDVPLLHVLRSINRTGETAPTWYDQRQCELPWIET